MTGSRIALPLGIAFFCAIAALTVLPAGIEGGRLLFAQDDPAELADRALDRLFDGNVATREINQALAADDADLAKSFVDLAHEREVALDPVLVARVEAADAAANSAASAAGSFARGLMTGEPDDLVGLAGTALGDLFVFGDIRDALREGTRYVMGQPTDNMILGLSCVGLAITAGTYATLGASTPARVGLSVVKAARKTGQMSARMTAWLGRSLREIVDISPLRRTISGSTLTEPVVAVRAVREAVKVEKTGSLIRLAGDVGRVQSKAGTKAAIDGLRVAEGPRDISRIARLAETKGSKTRAILKLGGRAALFLTVSTFNLFVWVLGAIMTVYGFCASCKRATERATERSIVRRKARGEFKRRHFATMTVKA